LRELTALRLVPQHSASSSSARQQSHLSNNPILSPPPRAHLEATVWGLEADADGDGLSNDAEFALGTNPRDGSDADGGIVQSIEPNPSGDLLLMSFLRRTDDPDLAATAEFCRDLSNWDVTGLEVIEVVDQGGGYERVTVRELPTPTALGRAFTRVTVTRVTP
jgi:hypothetical protein